MDLTQVRYVWPIVLVIGGFALTLIYAIRYKIPDHGKRLAKLEKCGAGKKDLESAIDSFHTVCRFNQVSCQKEIQEGTAKMLKEINHELAGLYERLNALAIQAAQVATKVEMMVENGKRKNEDS